MKITIEWGLEFPSADGKDWVETMFDVDCTLTPGDKGCHTMRNGDPGWPPSDAECDIEAIRLQGLGSQPGIDIPSGLWPLLGFTPKVFNQIEEKAFETAQDREDGAREDHADAERERRLERD